MSILVDKETRLLVQGITGREGAFHTGRMVAYGTNVVAGVTPGKGGETVHGVPVFDSVAQAIERTGANAAVIYVPARFCADAIYESASCASTPGDGAGISLIACITEGVPALDMIAVCAYLDQKRVRLVGPNCPGLITPGEAKVGIIPGSIVMPGPVGIVARSGTLTYEVMYALTLRGIGQSTCVGIGGDAVNGTGFIDCLELFEADPRTEQIVLIGEIGGTDEELAAGYIRDHVTKPVTAFVAGKTAPPGKRMGHAGAIIQGGSGTATEKISALQAAGVRVADHPEQIAQIIAGD
jgi:succinyl-CoA synthetase alpha subunit